MSWFTEIGFRVMSAINGFYTGWVTSKSLDKVEFDSWEARKLRDAINWASYQNKKFDTVNEWAQQYRVKYGLYKYIRNIYNPFWRDTEFFKMVIYGGILDPNAGNGGAVPIVTENEKLRPALARLWRDSNFAATKDILTTWGSALGNAGIRIVDDEKRKRVTTELVYPSTIKSVKLENGIVKAYTIEEARKHPAQDRNVVYTETAERGPGESVIFKTYLDGELYPWYENAAWEEGYGFIPLVLVKHIDVGELFGWNELHAAQSKIDEVDDQASILHDYIRKMNTPQWLANFQKPSTNPRAARGQETTDYPVAGREETPILYVPDKEAKMQALVADIDLAAATTEIQNILSELERDYPELREDIWSVVRDGSAPASRESRQKVEEKVRLRRNSYDTALVHVHQMAIAIGGQKKYNGYDGFDLGSFSRGELDHSIGERPVFKDPSVNVADKEVAARAISELVGAGMPIESALAYVLDWDKKKLTEFGTQKLAAIKLEQEDVVPTDESGRPLEQ